MQSSFGESGAMCLAMLLGHYGAFPKLTEVKKSCGCENGEIATPHLLDVLRKFGLDASSKKLSLDELTRRHDGPCIIATVSGTFLLLVKKTGSSFIVHDPEKGRKKLSQKELATQFSGLILTAEPGHDFVQFGHHASFVKDVMNGVLQYKEGMSYVLLAGFVLLIPAIVIPALSKIFFDDIILQGQTAWYRPMLMIMAALLVLGSILVFLQQWILLRFEIKMSMVESAKFVSHILSISYGYFQSHPAGDTVKRIKLNDAIATMLSRDLSRLIISLVTVSIYAIVMMKFSMLLTVAGVSVMLINLLGLKYFSAKRTALNQALFQKQQRTFNMASVGIEHIETVKASGWENNFFSLWSSYLVSFINDEQKLGVTSRLLTVLPEFLAQFNNVLIVLLGGVLIISGEISIGVFIAMQSFIANFADPVKNVVEIGGNFQLNKGNYNNLQDSLAEPIDRLCEQKQRTPIEEITPFNARLSGKMEVKNITFAYNKFDPPFIDNFSLSVAPGQRVALVGGSGCGKSTILKVLAGLYAPDSGEIFFDDMNSNTINSDVLRNSLAMVDQDVFLFTGTVSDNIVMWNRAVDNESIIKAAKDATIHEVISERPGGYQAMLAPGGGNFSGGQRQRLEIARALVSYPSILFMDEATSALDAKTEQVVMENIRKRGCTTITIAHRLSSIKDYDEILVIDKGAVVQRGSHEELLRQKDQLYYKLVSES